MCVGAAVRASAGESLGTAPLLPRGGGGGPRVRVLWKGGGGGWCRDGCRLEGRRRRDGGAGGEPGVRRGTAGPAGSPGRRGGGEVGGGCGEPPAASRLGSLLGGARAVSAGAARGAGR